MAKKPKGKVIKPVRVWMTDLVGGYVDVVESGFYIKFPHKDERVWHQMDRLDLCEAIKGINDDNRGAVIKGKLMFYGHNLGEKGEAELVILPSDEYDSVYAFEVGLSEFRIALMTRFD